MDYTILEQLENNTSAERLHSKAKEQKDIINQASITLIEQAEEINQLRYQVLRLREMNLELRREIASMVDVEPLRNEDYPTE